jgi:hypothetical protein
MLLLENVDLARDPGAAPYLKSELVVVEFARTDGVLESRVGANAYRVGDALVLGEDGERWCVSRERFLAKYEPLPPLAAGATGRYRNRPVPVLAKRMHAPFRCRRSAGGDLLEGAAGDWLLEYAPGDHGVARAERFARVYRPLAR